LNRIEILVNPVHPDDMDILSMTEEKLDAYATTHVNEAAKVADLVVDSPLRIASSLVTSGIKSADRHGDAGLINNRT